MVPEKTDAEPRCPVCGSTVRAMTKRLDRGLIMVAGHCQECDTVWNFNYELTIVERAP